MEKMLGKITSAKFGICGYQDAMIGLFLSFESNSRGCSWSMSTWDPGLIECSKHCKWTEEDRDKTFSETVRFISKILSEAKKSNISELVGVPVEMEFDNGTLKDWRILTEVL